jgi:hypothetical protein
MCTLQRILLDDHARPDGIEQGGLVEKLVGPPQQRAQQVEGAAAELDRTVRSNQLTLVRSNGVVTECHLHS